MLNTNGYGYFAETLLNISQSSITSDKIIGDHVVALPTNITVPLIIPRSDMLPISQYSSPMGDSLFVVEKRFGKGQLFYVNINPILKAISSSYNQSVFYELESELLKDVNLQKFDPASMFKFDAAVKEISIRNNVEIRTDSVIFPTEVNVKQLDTIAEDGLHSFYNVTRIDFRGNSSLALSLDDVLVSNGNGFYAILQANSTFVVNSDNGSMGLTISTVGEETTLNDVRQITVTPTNSIQLTVRTPTVGASEVTFLEFYPEGSLRSSTRTYGQNLKATGTTEFTIMFSDSYSFLKNVKLGTSLQQDPSPTSFDELTAIPTGIFFAMLLILILIIISCITLILPERTIDKESAHALVVKQESTHALVVKQESAKHDACSDSH